MANPVAISPPYLASAGHPDRLAVRAQLCGFASLAPWSLPAFSGALPNGRLVGIELSQAAIAQGREWVDGLGLANVELHARELHARDLDGDWHRRRPI